MIFSFSSPRNSHKRATIACLLAICVFEISLAAPLESPDELFEKKIRPVLVEHCYKCHASTSKRLKGGLELDTRAGVLKGGDAGTTRISS